MKQVDQMIAKLASKYHFSEDEARRFLDLPVEVKAKPSTKPSTKPKAGKPKADQEGGEYLGRHTTRLPSAYQNFVKAESGRIRDLLLAESGVSKLERGQLQKELGARWKAMSSQDKAIYQK